MPFPVLRAMMSKIIPGTEQGKWVERACHEPLGCIVFAESKVPAKTLLVSVWPKKKKKYTKKTQNTFIQLLRIYLCFHRSPVCFSLLFGLVNFQCVQYNLQQCVCCHRGLVLWVLLPAVCRALCHPALYPGVSAIMVFLCTLKKKTTLGSQPSLS